MSSDDLGYTFSTALVPLSPSQTWNGSDTLVANDAYSLWPQDSNLYQTLAHPLSPQNGVLVQGLLYVPTLATRYADCVNKSGISIAANITNLKSSFPGSWSTTAIFPWTNASCAQAYLEQAAMDDVQGVFTFLLNGNGSLIPNASDSSWHLQGNNSWQATYPYTVFAINAADGRSLLTELSYYSGSMMAAPFGQNLTQEYGPDYLPRIYAEVWSNYYPPTSTHWQTSLGAGLGFLLLIMLYIPLSSWFLRRRQIRSFQHRLQRGEINLEALGIKQTTVPETLINKMPLFNFTATSQATDTIKTTDVSIQSERSGEEATPLGIARSASEMFSSSSQTTCPVCLDEFVDGETKVRELPCKHIFHPECVDLYLRDVSSLCPMCKNSALPLGYCPVRVTYPMVIQELANRRRQQRRNAARGPTATAAAQPAHITRPAFSPPIHYTGHRTIGQATGVEAQEDVEMTAVERDSQVTLTEGVDRDEVYTVPAEIAAQGAEARRTWHRERLAQQRQEVFNVASENARRVIESRPAWRRVIDRMMPGMV